jgi:shikimate dehydrogenase
LSLSTNINFLNLKTKFFFSISNNPSTRGSNFYNKFFKKKNFIYLPLKIKNKIIFKEIIIFLKKKIINFGGASISMPYKEEIMKYVDKKDITVKVTKNANTIILSKNKLISYNTDYLAAKKILKNIRYQNVILIGAGALAKTFLSLQKNKNVYVVNKSKKNISKLNKLSFKIIKFNFSEVNKIKNFIVINTTPSINKIKIYNYINFNNAKLIIDCPISSKLTNLNKIAKKFSIKYINGCSFYHLQRFFQKKLYLNEKL